MRHFVHEMTKYSPQPTFYSSVCTTYLCVLILYAKPLSISLNQRFSMMYTPIMFVYFILSTKRLSRALNQRFLIVLAPLRLLFLRGHFRDLKQRKYFGYLLYIDGMRFVCVRKTAPGTTIVSHFIFSALYSRGYKAEGSALYNPRLHCQ